MLILCYDLHSDNGRRHAPSVVSSNDHHELIEQIPLQLYRYLRLMVGLVLVKYLDDLVKSESHQQMCPNLNGTGTTVPHQ